MIDERSELMERIRQLDEKDRIRRIDELYPNLKLIVGKYYKFKNSYSLPSCEEDYWNLYIRVDGLDKDNIYLNDYGTYQVLYNVTKFQKPNDNVFKFELGICGIDLFEEEISEIEFIKEFDKFVNAINILRNK